MAATAVIVSAVLSLGAGYSGLPEVGQVAARDFQADKAGRVEDLAATEALQQAAADSVEDIYSRISDAEVDMTERVERFFGEVASGVTDDAPIDNTPPTTIPSTTIAESPGTTLAGSSTTTQPVEVVDLTGALYIDVDSDGRFDRDEEDRGLPGVTVSAIDATKRKVEVVTDSDGSYRFPGIAVGTVLIDVDQQDPDYPTDFSLAGDDPQSIECGTDKCEAKAVALTPNLRPLEEPTARLKADYPDLEPATITYLVQLAADDVVIGAVKGEVRLPAVKEAVLNKLEALFVDQIRSIAEEEEAERVLFERPPRVLFGTEASVEAGASAADVIAMVLRPNSRVDRAKTDAAISAARIAVLQQGRNFLRGDTIVNQGETVTEFDRAAIDQLVIINAPGTVIARTGVIGVLVALLAFYMARFRSENWRPLRRVVLLSVLLFLGASAVAGTAIVESSATWYVLPAVAVGLMTSILFDPRVGALMAVAMAVMAAVATTDAGLAVYALLATMAPIGFVSSISTRTATRTAVLFSALAAGFIAAAVAGFFHVPPGADTLMTVGVSAAWAGASSLVAGLVGLAAVQFLETAFDVTTAVRLLDLTDRNHAALQLLQDKAFGTFNHSLMVGTLADAAAKAVGANNLLARAAAYYHDIGKTQNPGYFIENQMAMANPHDDLSPEESVAIIRRHVSDGMVLAKEFKIPADVSEGILTHHGDAIVRFFYEKARAQREADQLDPASFRHFGHKPQSAEMAILMLADSLEGACRAVFQEEEPTPDSVKKVVDRVVDEKVNDGQLSECSLTLAELTRVRVAFIEALIGHYHQRIPYPNFPGT